MFSFQSTYNIDNHFEVVEYIFKNKALPTPFQFQQAQHPPLYYILGSIFLNFGGAKTLSLNKYPKLKKIIYFSLIVLFGLFLFYLG